MLKKQVAELQQKSKDNEYIIGGKMQERDEGSHWYVIILTSSFRLVTIVR